MNYIKQKTQQVKEKIKQKAQGLKNKAANKVIEKEEKDSDKLAKKTAQKLIYGNVNQIAPKRAVVSGGLCTFQEGELTILADSVDLSAEAAAKIPAGERDTQALSEALTVASFPARFNSFPNRKFTRRDR